jgi:hypothetical protein
MNYSNSRASNADIINVHKHVYLNTTLREHEHGGVGLGSGETKMHKRITRRAYQACGDLFRP